MTKIAATVSAALFEDEIVLESDAVMAFGKMPGYWRHVSEEKRMAMAQKYGLFLYRKLHGDHEGLSIEIRSLDMEAEAEMFV